MTFKITYHRRLFLGLVAYSCLLLICFAVFQYHREKQFKAEELNARLQGINDGIIDQLAIDGTNFRPEQLKFPAFPGLRISVIDSLGKVVYDNSLDSLPGSNHLNRSEIASAIAKGEGYSLRRHSESTGETYFYSAKQGEGFIVRTAVPYTMTLHQLLAADYAFFWFMIGVTVVMCIIGYFATRRLGRHVERLNTFARKAESGERIYDTAPFPHDELGDISNHIVRLYAQLQQATADRDREHRLALHQEQEKIRIKHQLTNNINHELKTPLASMQVCLETLLTHDNLPVEKQKEFLGRCYKANRRLINLLEDVSTITRIDDGGQNISHEDVDISAIIYDVADEYREMAASKGIEIQCNVTPGVLINGNSSLLSSIFRNLISNAIAYSGGTLVRIRMHADGGSCVSFTVDDNGKGVGEEHLPRLFERFYRVDKGRSRNAGGTGLGLSIVKNAVNWHGGRISVENKKSGGLIFRFGLRKDVW